MVHWRKKWQPTPYSYKGNPMNGMKRQKDMTLDEPPSQKVSNILLGKHGGQLLIASGRMKRLGQSRSDAQLWMCLVVKVKFDAVSENIV